MLLVFTILAVLGILVGAAFLATYEGDVLRDPHPDDRDATLPAAAVQPEDIGELRFDLAFRGYRMSEVDRVLFRLRDELAERDTRIAELERALAAPPRIEEPATQVPDDVVPAAPVEAYEPLEPPAQAPAAISGPLTATTWFTEAAPETPEPRPSFTLDASDDAFSFPELTPPPPAEPPTGEQPPSP